MGRRGRRDEDDYDYDDDDDLDEDDEEEEEEDFEQVLFQGALNGRNPDMAANGRLVQMGFKPTKHLVSDALSRRAMAIRLEPKGPGSLVAFVVDNVPYPGARLPKQQALAITQMLKLLAGLDIKERRKPQEGGIHAEFDEKKYELGIETIPTSSGVERLIIRVRNLEANIESPHNLLFSDEFKKRVRDGSTHKRGLLFVCGSPKSGVTTIMHGVLRCIDCYLYGVYSIADVGTRELINVTEFKANEGDSLDKTLMRIIREDGDVVFVNTPQNVDEAKTLFDRAEDIAILTEIPAKDTSEGLLKLVKLMGDPALVADRVHGIVTFKYVRILCEACKQAFRPNPRFLAKVGLPPETKKLYRSYQPPRDEDGEIEDFEPCRHCGGVGFSGMAPVMELIEMSDRMKEVITQRPSIKNIKLAASKDQMITLQADGLRMVLEGHTALEELQRVFR